MERRKTSDFHPEVLRLFDQYVHGLIDRRGFLAGAAKFAVGGVLIVASATPDGRKPTGGQVEVLLVEAVCAAWGSRARGHVRQGIWPRCHRFPWLFASL